MAFKKVINGYYNSAIIKSDNTLWMAGSNRFGQFGVGNGVANGINFIQVGFDISPEFVKVFDEVADIAIGNSTMVIKTDGTLWVSGYGLSGELGLGDYDDRDTFEQILTPINVIDVAIGLSHSLAVKSDGTLWSSGSNNNGQLGIGSTGELSINSFRQVQGLENIVAVSAGDYHSIALKNDGTVWVAGNNNVGQLGLGSQVPGEDIYTFTKVTTTDSLGQVVDVIATDVKCMGNNTLLLKNDRTLWGAGDNSTGELGLGDDKTSVSAFTQICTQVNDFAAGEEFCIVLQDDGTLLATGDNSAGQFGKEPGTLSSSSRFIVIAQELGTNVEKIGAGHYHSILVTNNGNVYVSGDNDFGQLGEGTTNDKTSFTLINVQDPIINQVAGSALEKKARFKILQGLSTCFATQNPLLLEGEWAYETDTKKLKIGDGITLWNDLEYKVDKELTEHGKQIIEQSETFMASGDQPGGYVTSDSFNNLRADLDDLNNRIETYIQQVKSTMGVEGEFQDQATLMTAIINNIKGLLDGLQNQFSPENIKNLYEQNTGVAVFTEAEKLKLAEIEEGADKTDPENVREAGAIVVGDVILRSTCDETVI